MDRRHMEHGMAKLGMRMRDQEMREKRFREIYRDREKRYSNIGGTFHYKMAIVLYDIYVDHTIPKSIRDIGGSAVVTHIRHEISQYNKCECRYEREKMIQNCPFWNIFGDFNFVKRLERGWSL